MNNKQQRTLSRLDDILNLLGINKLEESDKDEVKNKLYDLVTEIAMHEHPAISLTKPELEQIAEHMNDLIDGDEEQITEETSTLVWPVANLASSSLNDSSKALGALINLILFMQTGEKKFASLAQKLSSASNETNESAELYLYKKVQGLTLKQQEFMLEMLENCTIEEIEKRFDRLLKESANSDKPKQHTCVCPHCNHELESTKECNLLECPECGESKMKTKKSVNDGLGFTELGKVNEDKSPFDDDIDQYKNIWNKE
jgi:predicted RNA-binding Zn-ribbon protein involved in translation (DUF1610 family)